MNETGQPTLAPILTALDRCDSCGAQAYMKVVLPGNLDLLFCGHHSREHGDKAKVSAISVIDETHLIPA